LQDAISIGGVHDASGPKTTATAGILGLEQMPFASAGTHDFARSGNFKALGHRFSRFDAFGTSHIFNNPLLSKGREI
jgi:hypothetical protein